jgi:DNA polymerase-3 subunit chi
LAEVLFYHLTQTPLERSLPQMLQASYSRNWRVVVRGTHAGRIEMLDALLWTQNEESFLPHATDTADFAADQPILLTTSSEVPNGATVLMLIDRARATPEERARFDRTCVLFNGADQEELELARADWKQVRDEGVKAVYWAQEDGKWTEKMSING